MARRMAFNYGRWSHLVASGRFSSGDLPAFSGTSGGATSGMMTALLDERTIPTFQNTGREHPGTYDFLEQFDDALGGRIVWLEFRKPRRKGAPPREFEFAIVNARTADRSGAPFEDFLEALEEYRREKGEPPISPWARQRICTAYMKQKVADHYIASLGVRDCDRYVGLRRDEPDRVIGLKEYDTKRQTFQCPLYDVGIVKADVREFWDAQGFRLAIRENQGNCTACFLKDQGDIARVLMEPETDAGWWLSLGNRYPGFGGQRFPGYEQLALEGPARLRIEEAIRAGREPAPEPCLGERRFKLVVVQERRRVAGEVPSFHCACEQSYALGGDDEDDAAA